MQNRLNTKKGEPFEVAGSLGWSTKEGIRKEEED